MSTELDGPFEETDGVQATTLWCPCDHHHNRDEYTDTGFSFRGTMEQHPILRCPKGRYVYMIYSHLDFGGQNANAYAEITVEPLPEGASCFPSPPQMDVD